ncbi:hypothetical protein F5887DRAFT_1202146 [Amanita rubescens]|nr:hypothetical protein F5887DRAFT_1202146 [Amanita rubescens]
MCAIDRGPLPPSFEKYREYERTLPQNNESLPLPEGKDGMYLLIENYSTHVGWGNLLEELIMHAFLAYSSKRSLVLYDFIWDPNSPDYTLFNGKYIPSRLPISVTFAGPIAGGSMGPEYPGIPRAVSREYFNRVCSDKLIIDTDGLKWELQHATGAQITRAWVQKLDAIGHRCIVIPKESSHIYDNILFGEPRLLDIWPELKQSPILQRFAWSPLIVDAYDRTQHLFESKTNKSDALSETATLPNHLDGLLVVHGHCQYLQKQDCGYNAFNMFRELLATVRQNHETLRRLYIMTNDKGSWLASLLEKLEQTASWEMITTSRDLNFTREQKFASQALDALVAQRAEAFIGNGFSSLTSNINMLRMAGNLDPASTYFW